MTKPITVVIMLALIAVLAVVPGARSAPGDFFDSNKPVQCGPFREIVGLISGPDFREQPTWIGPSSTDGTSYVLFRNPRTQSWTLVQYGKETGCVLGLGRTDTIYLPVADN